MRKGWKPWAEDGFMIVGPLRAARCQSLYDDYPTIELLFSTHPFFNDFTLGEDSSPFATVWENVA